VNTEKTVLNPTKNLRVDMRVMRRGCCIGGDAHLQKARAASSRMVSQKMRNVIYPYSRKAALVRKAGVFITLPCTICTHPTKTRIPPNNSES
jgi:hypothetical protein